jgi:hypothetical protein
MTPTDFYQLTTNMQKNGGSFIASLGATLQNADSLNRKRILDAFPEILIKYGGLYDHQLSKDQWLEYLKVKYIYRSSEC